MTFLSRKAARARVGVDLHVLEGIYQGSRTHCLELFSRIPALAPQIDFRFFVDTQRWNPHYRERFTAENAQVVSMPHTSSAQRLLFQLPALARLHGIDLLHTQYICPPFVTCANAATIHDILFEDFPQYFAPLLRLRLRLLCRRSARHSRLVFTVSEYSRTQLSLHYGVDRSSITALTNGVDLFRFFPGSQGADAVKSLGLTPGDYLLSVGRLEPRKNYAGLLRAYAALPDPRPSLILCGQRDFGFQEIFQMIRERGLARDVQILETVDDDQLAALYRHCRAFLYPTFAEGFGMPVLEAMASGAPVITSNTTALPEIAGDAAVLIDPNSDASLIEAMERILRQPDLCRELAVRGLAQAANFTWDASAATLAASYRSCFPTA